MKSEKKFPEGTTFGTWFPVKEDSRWYIRRTVTLPNGKRTLQRLDKKTYSAIPNNLDAMLKHCDRLNFGANMERLRQREINTAFLPNTLVDGFYTELLATIPNKPFAKYLFDKVLKIYVLDFFVNTLKVPDPKLWQQHQLKFGLALLSDKNTKHRIFSEPASARTITLVIQTANRFLKYLNQQGTYPLIKIQPVSKAALKLYSAEQQDGEPVGKFISESEWLKIQRRLPADISPFIHLMYFYGLRRSESLGIRSADAVRRDYLLITDQLKEMGNSGSPIYSPLKSREQRKTPHWQCPAKRTHTLVKQSLENKMHPDTLSQKWENLMRDLGMDYRLHDLRRTFITNVLRTQNARDVQLAVGHTDLRTTMGYAQDDRSLGDEVFVPDAS